MRAIVRVVLVVGTALVLHTAAGELPSANADPLIGKTYKDASATVAGWGSTPVIRTVSGGHLAIDDCIVTSWQKSSFLDSAGRPRKGAVLINLDCNAAIAAAGTPGNSAASPEGKAAKRNLETANWCAQSAQANFKPCATFWEQHPDLYAQMQKVMAEQAKKDEETAEFCDRPENATFAPCAKFCNEHDGLCTATF